jgi:hypothetical protein
MGTFVVLNLVIGVNITSLDQAHADARSERGVGDADAAIRSIRESLDDLRSAVDAESKPLERLRAFTIRLHEWCEPLGTRRKRGAHNRVPLSEFSLQLALKDPDRLVAAMAPVSRMLVDVLKAAVDAGAIKVDDTQRAAMLIQQIVMYGWLMNRLVRNSRARVTAEDAWEFCLHGLGG